MKYLFILGNHKSGTSLLRSLFDNHKNIFAIPIETHPFKHLGFPIKYEMNKFISEDDDLDLEKIIENFVHWIRLNNSQRDSKFGGNYGYNQFNEDLFIEFLLKNINQKSSYKEYIEYYLNASYYSSIAYNQNTKIDYIAEKSVENFEYAFLLNNYFDDSKFIHIIRNPYSNVVSLRKYYQEIFNGCVYYGNIIRGISSSYYFAVRNQKIIENYVIIRYEDLLEDAEKVMKKLSFFLGIEFNEDLLKPTVMGENWTGNSVKKEQFTKIESLNKEYWKKDISPYEKKLVNNHLGEYMKKFHYDLLKVSLYSSLIPQKNEGIKCYIKNRSQLII